MGVGAKVVADSIAAGSRLITLEIELHRMILPEFNTHRVFSRNFQSSRAIPMARQRELVEADPAMPVYWGENQSGMVANNELSVEGQLKAKKMWRIALKDALYIHKTMEKLGVHKQIANRLLEPFMYTRGVVTATERSFNSFFKLRCAYDAQPEIKAIADAMKKAISRSEPAKLSRGDWHLPYVDINDYDSLTDAINVSVAACAQVSYRKLDLTVEKANKIVGMLNLDGSGGNPHASPCEHQAFVDPGTYTEWSDAWENINAIGISGNFEYPWHQYRKTLGV